MNIGRENSGEEHNNNKKSGKKQIKKTGAELNEKTRLIHAGNRRRLRFRG
jgi:hypothetical protein